MKRIVHSIILIAFCHSGFAQVLPNLGGQRAGNAALSFLKIDVSPSSNALGGASVAMPGDGYAQYVNPALMAHMDTWNVSLSTQQNGTGTQQAWLSGIIPTKNAGAFGVSLDYFSSGEMDVRTEFQPLGTGQTIQATNYAIGLGYSKELSDMFKLGVNLKYIREDLAEYHANAVVADLAFFYQTDWKNLAFAVMVQNFGGNSSLNGDYVESPFNRTSSGQALENYGAPTIFRLGTTLDVLNTDPHRLIFAFELQHPSDNAENFRLGMEYRYKEIFFGRAGYKLNVEGQSLPTFGFGFRMMAGAHPLMLDYAAVPTNYMGFVHSVGLSFTFTKKESRE